jgi:hypothetical protein
MEIQTNCPACGAQISVSQSGGHFTCPYCSTNFEVNMDGVQPAFKVASKVEEMAAETPPVEVTPSSELGGFIQPPADSTFQHPPADTTFQSYPTPQPGRFTGQRLWLIVAVVVASVFCLTCLCMTIVVRNFIH